MLAVRYPINLYWPLFSDGCALLASFVYLMFFSRSHALSITDTLGTFFVLTGVAFYQGLTLADVKIMLILLALWHLNPVISHVILRVALRNGVRPWVKEKK